MSLHGALSIATGGLANVNSQLALVSQNVANASTPGYAAEIATQQSVTADGQGLGVRTGLPIRNIDATLQAELYSQNATVAGLQTQQTALQAIDAAQGTPGQGTDIASLLGNLQDQFSTLLNDPSSGPQQSQVVSTARTLAQRDQRAQRHLHDAAADGGRRLGRRGRDTQHYSQYDRLA